MTRRLLVYTAQMGAAGGIESHLEEFCARLAGAGWAITMLCSRWAAPVAVERRLAGAGIELIANRARWSSASPAARGAWTALQLRRLARGRFGVVYVNGQGRNPAAVVQAFRGRARTVHHHHTACDAGDVATWPVQYRTAMHGADALVVCADFVRQRMQRELARDDVDVVYCFSRQLDVPAPEIAAAPLVFGYFGRLIREKGIDWIVRLSRDARLHGIEWRVWGPPTPLVDEIRNSGSVRYCGAFDDEAGLRAVLATLHCYCLFSSVPEGLPIALLEATGAGRPWIATSQGGVPELAADPAWSVLVDLRDYEGVVSACAAMRDRIRSRPQDRTGLVRAYASRFSAGALVDRWERVLTGTP